MKTIIGSFLGGFFEVAENTPNSTTVSEAEFAELQLKSVLHQRAARYEAEASIYDIIDAEAKMASPSAAVRESGEQEKAALLARRLKIKEELPKP